MTSLAMMQTCAWCAVAGCHVPCRAVAAAATTSALCDVQTAGYTSKAKACGGGGGGGAGCPVLTTALQASHATAPPTVGAIMRVTASAARPVGGMTSSAMTPALSMTSSGDGQCRGIASLSAMPSSRVTYTHRDTGSCTAVASRRHIAGVSSSTGTVRRYTSTSAGAACSPTHQASGTGDESPGSNASADDTTTTAADVSASPLSPEQALATLTSIGKPSGEDDLLTLHPRRVGECERLLSLVAEHFTWESVHTLAACSVPLFPVLRSKASPALLAYLGAMNEALVKQHSLSRRDVVAVLTLWNYAPAPMPHFGAAVTFSARALAQHSAAARSVYHLMELVRALRFPLATSDDAILALIAQVYTRLEEFFRTASPPNKPHQVSTVVEFCNSVALLRVHHGPLLGALSKYLRRLLTECQVASMKDARTFVHVFAYMKDDVGPLLADVKRCLVEPGGKFRLASAAAPTSNDSTTASINDLVLLNWSYVAANLSPPSTSMHALCQQLDERIAAFESDYKLHRTAVERVKPATEGDVSAKVLRRFPLEPTHFTELIQLLPALPRRIHGLVPLLELGLWATELNRLGRRLVMFNRKWRVNEVIGGTVFAIGAFSRSNGQHVMWSQTDLPPQPAALDPRRARSSAFVPVAMVVVPALHRLLAPGMSWSGSVEMQRRELAERGFHVLIVPKANLLSADKQDPVQLSGFCRREMFSAVTAGGL
eukprot:scpid43977/ scgid31426/ 